MLKTIYSLKDSDNSILGFFSEKPELKEGQTSNIEVTLDVADDTELNEVYALMRNGRIILSVHNERDVIEKRYNEDLEAITETIKKAYNTEDVSEYLMVSNDPDYMGFSLKTDISEPQENSEESIITEKYNEGIFKVKLDRKITKEEAKGFDKPAIEPKQAKTVMCLRLSKQELLEMFTKDDETTKQVIALINANVDEDDSVVANFMTDPSYDPKKEEEKKKAREIEDAEKHERWAKEDEENANKQSDRTELPEL